MYTILSNTINVLPMRSASWPKMVAPSPRPTICIVVMRSLTWL